MSMANIRYETMTDLRHADEVVAMMNNLYHEDQAASKVDPRRFPVTLRTFLDRPEAGRVVLIWQDDALVGYSLLVPYWSNEFGGVILFVDELYVVESSRGLGTGRGFFVHIDQERPFDAAVVALEVSRTNSRARRLYERLGLTERSNAVLVSRLPLVPQY